jgi:hypothetical protein
VSSSFVDAWRMVEFLCVNRGRSIPYFLEYSVFECLQHTRKIQSQPCEIVEEWMDALSALTIVQSERLIVSSGQDELAPIIKTNTGYMSLSLR